MMQKKPNKKIRELIISKHEVKEEDIYLSKIT